MNNKKRPLLSFQGGTGGRLPEGREKGQVGEKNKKKDGVGRFPGSYLSRGRRPLTEKNRKKKKEKILRGKGQSPGRHVPSADCGDRKKVVY